MVAREETSGFAACGVHACAAELPAPADRVRITTHACACTGSYGTHACTHTHTHTHASVCARTRTPCLHARLLARTAPLAAAVSAIAWPADLRTVATRSNMPSVSISRSAGSSWRREEKRREEKRREGKRARAAHAWNEERRDAGEMKTRKKKR